MIKRITMLAIFVLFAGFMSVTTAQDKTAQKAEKITFKGPLMDKMCYDGHKNEVDSFCKTHTKACLVSCGSHGGFGVVADGKYIPFDAEGNKKAKALLEKTTKDKNMVVEAEGTLKDGVLTVTSLKET